MRTQAPKRLGKNKNFTKDTEEKKDWESNWREFKERKSSPQC